MPEAATLKAISKITEQAISKITEQAIFLYGVNEKVRELVTEMGYMRAFLKDVDLTKHTEERVKTWANDIRDIAQDAEGLVENFAIEVKQRKGEDITCVCSILANVVKEVVARYKVGWGIEKIHKRINNLTENLKKYHVNLDSVNEVGETSSCREVILQSGGCGDIGVEKWGGSGGKHWNYRPKGLVKQIVVTHGWFIDSIMFKSIEENGVIESSQTFGGPKGGPHRTEINIDCPSQYLTGLSGTYGLFGPYLIIKSIKFHTSVGHYGPMGSVTETESDTKFSFIMKGGSVVGFHGFSGLYLDAIGLYVKPKNTNS